jgi:hypothetical protein
MTRNLVKQSNPVLSDVDIPGRSYCTRCLPSPIISHKNKQKRACTSALHFNPNEPETISAPILLDVHGTVRVDARQNAGGKQ